MAINEQINQQKVDILALKRLKVLDENGLEVPICSFWDKQTAVIIFLRHFGCIVCRAHVDQVLGVFGEKKHIYFVGNGTPNALKKFKHYMGNPNVMFYTDPSKKTFDACGMQRGFSQLLSAKTLTHYLELKRKGYSQGAFDSESGNHLQMGGVVVFKPPGKVLYHQASEYFGDVEDPIGWQHFRVDSSKAA